MKQKKKKWSNSVTTVQVKEAYQEVSKLKDELEIAEQNLAEVKNKVYTRCHEIGDIFSVGFAANELSTRANLEPPLRELKQQLADRYLDQSFDVLSATEDLHQESTDGTKGTEV